MQISIPEHLALHHGGADVYAGGRKFAETFALWGGLTAEHTILDIGCGPGRMAIGIGEHFGWTNEYVGFDIKKADIDFCKEIISAQYPGFQFFLFDLENDHYNKGGKTSATSLRFPAEDQSRDFVFATSIFTHFFSAEIQHYLSESARVARGKVMTTWFIIDELFFKGEEANTLRFAFPFTAEDGTRYQKEKSPLDAVGHRIEKIEQWHKDAGLKITAIHHGAWTRQNPVKGRHSQDIVVAEPL